MLVSKRRLKWTAITLLIMCLLLFFRPTRNWIDRMLVAWLISPSVSVGELVTYRSKAIVEARQFRWSENLGDRRITFSAKHGWFAYDKLGLVDRHTRLPKVILQDTNLRLDCASSAPAVHLDLWKQRLAQQITEIDWGSINQQFSCLLATRTLKAAWSDSVQRWVARSQQILLEAEELERQSIQLDNPLRFEDLIQAKLDRIKELSSEHRQLSLRFDELDTQFKSETERLKELQRQDHLKLVGLVIGNVAIEELQRERQRISKELSEELGRALWLCLAPYAEVMDQLADAAQRAQHRPNYDVNIRSNQHGNEWLQIARWKAAGKFNYGNLESLFQASGNWELTQSTDRSNNLEFGWQATFHRNHSQVDVLMEHASQNSEARQLVLRLTKTSLNSRELVTLQPIAVQADNSVANAHANLTSLAGRLSGKLTIQPEALTCIDVTTMPTWLHINAQSDAEPLRFDITGHWTDFKLGLLGDTPNWLSQIVANEAETRLKVASEAARQQLDQVFEIELMQLKQLVVSAIGDSKSRTLNHGNQLLAAQSRLQQQLDERDGTEFARRPGTVTR